jgi:hypothetical protein
LKPAAIAPPANRPGDYAYAFRVTLRQAMKLRKHEGKLKIEHSILDEYDPYPNTPQIESGILP